MKSDYSSESFVLKGLIYQVWFFQLNLSTLYIYLFCQKYHVNTSDSFFQFNAVNAGAKLGLATPLTTAASVSFFLTRIAFI